ncbi:hypothetical protein [Arenimonas daejeonensis]|uniref:hypothetical protein n=1 Tax=Arenimonas daejeonensis TaxID=370777 RepID=UPI0011BD5166|nr:hypothetical protein [Arenimonas daejeonensis]
MSVTSDRVLSTFGRHQQTSGSQLEFQSAKKAVESIGWTNSLFGTVMVLTYCAAEKVAFPTKDWGQVVSVSTASDGHYLDAQEVSPARAAALEWIFSAPELSMEGFARAFRQR